MKIFGIGLNKTGLTSLCWALNDLGFSVLQYPCDEGVFCELVQGKFKLSVLNEVDGIVDFPAMSYYQQFDKMYSDSKFILTVRNKESWMESCQRQYTTKVVLEKSEPVPSASKDHGRKYTYKFGFGHVSDLVTFGSCFFSHERWSRVYDLHHSAVTSYFQGRSDLLILDVVGGEGWDKLCKFLDRPIPKSKFPYQNSWQERKNVFKSRQKLVGML